MNELREVLSAPLPNEAVKDHGSKSFLSSIKSIYITERFNEAFGVGKWRVETHIIDLDKNTGMVLMKVHFSVPTLDIYYECIAGNDNGGIDKKGFDLGDACKGAISDALSKIGSWMGVGKEVYQGKLDNKTAKKQERKDGLEPFKTRDTDGNWLNIHESKGSTKYSKDIIEAFDALKKGYTIKDLRGYWAVNKEVAQTLERWMQEYNKQNEK